MVTRHERLHPCDIGVVRQLAWHCWLAFRAGATFRRRAHLLTGSTANGPWSWRRSVASAIRRTVKGQYPAHER